MRSYRQFLTSLAVLAALGLLATGAARAATRNVPTTEYPTIQSAIDAAASGDTILVAAGTYHESLLWGIKNLTIQGAGAGQSILDPSVANGGPGGPCLTTAFLTSVSRLEGFTLQNGIASIGGGMYNYSSSPTITNCTFTANSATNNGGGMYNNYSNPTVTNCTFSGNSAENGGGGMRNTHSSPTVTNCNFIGNSAGVGGGMFNYDSSSPTVTNCTFSRNSAENGPGGGMLNASYGNVKVTNCILWGNTTTWDGAGMISYYTSPTVTYSDVQDLSNDTPDANGNFAADPLFVDAANGDLHLLAGSPCLNAGNNAVVTSPPFLVDPTGTFIVDLDGNPRVVHGTVDLGAYEIQTNRAPTLDVPGTAAVNIGCPTTFQATATDPDGDAVTFSLVNSPSWASIDASTGVITLDPPVGTGGAFTVTVQATDSYGAYDQKSVSVTVCPLKITNISLARKDSRMVIVTFNIVNTSATMTVTNVSINSASLGGSPTVTTLPLLYTSIKPGASKSANVQFLNLPSGPAQFIVNGTSSAGPVNANRAVSVP